MAKYSIEQAKRTVKERDAWWTVLLIDPFVVRVIPFIANRTFLTPNHLTLLALVFATFTGVAFFVGTYSFLLLGVAANQIRFFLDCADGKLARLTGSSTNLGLFLDHFTDIVGFVVMFSMLGIGQWKASGSVIFLFLSGFFITTCFYDRLTSSWLEQFLGRRADYSLVETKTKIRFFSWLKKHRLANFPSTVEAETIVLFFGPLLNQVLAGFIVGSALMLFHNFKNTYKLFVSLKGT